ncbi:hypothetical protein ES703_02994 [subsurface metagenome]
MIQLKSFLDGQNKEIKKISTEMNLSHWEALISGKKEAYQNYEKKAIELEKYFTDKENFKKIKSFLEIVKDPLEKRQLELLYLSYLSGQGDLKLIEEITKRSALIEQKFNTFRANLNGEELTDNEIKEILKHEKDSEKLRKTWEASKKQGEIVEKEVIELVKLRNKLAKSLGFENYYVMDLELEEQKEEEIEKIFLELEKSTQEPFKVLKNELDVVFSKRYGIEKGELKPWHYHNLFFQEGPEIFDIGLDKIYNKDILEITKKFYQELNLEVRDILERSDLYEKPGKYQHACCMNINREGDVRIVENIKNNESWMSTTLHELGHAVYDKYCDKVLPFLLKENAHIFVTEAIAILFERNSKNKAFIRRCGNIESEDVEKIEKEIRKQLKLDELVFLKWAQVVFHFERELYKNPEQDLNKLWWSLVKKYQLIDFSRDKPDWASKIHLACYPVYYHNYVLGKILASQINHYIFKDILKQDSENPDYSNPKIGDYLKEKIFMLGKKYRWDKLIEKALGEPLTSKYFVEDFCN